MKCPICAEFAEKAQTGSLPAREVKLFMKHQINEILDKIIDEEDEEIKKNLGQQVIEFVSNIVFSPPNDQDIEITPVDMREFKEVVLSSPSPTIH